MSDPVDMAQLHEEHLRRIAVARVRVATDRDGADACVQCGEIIPEARRKAVPWATRCLECQSLAERSHSRGR